MLNVSGAVVRGDNSCLCSKGYQIDLHTAIVTLEAELFPRNIPGSSFTPSCPATSHFPYIFLSLFLRPLDEHCGGGGGPDGTPSRDRGRRGESASQGEGRMSLLLRHPQKQP